MRILSWNINGIRTLPQYHPWNTLKTGEAILNELKADIICFQEMKSSRSALEKHIAVPPSYDSYFSFPVAKGGYSGVAVYTSANATAGKAEEGITGSLQPKPPFSSEEKIGGYPSVVELVERLVPDEQGNTPSDLGVLDTEGRGLVVDFGLFVLINVYCPNETSDARLPFKMNYHIALEERVRKLVAQGREVIVLGDINICSTPLDHCDGHLPSNQENFYHHPARRWFHKWIGLEGPMTDVVRTFHPNREGMYTCWNMKIMARETNYGTRVDYILVTPGLLPWIKHGDIQPSLKGSDHCPIYIDLHETIVDSEGRTRTLKEEIGNVNPERREPARLASRNWDEYSGKQKLLSSFFGKGKSKAPEVDIGSPVSTSAATILASTTSTSSNNTNVGTNEAVSSATQLPSSNMKDHSALQGGTARKSTLPSAPPITLSIIPISAPAPSSPTGQTPLKRKSSHSSMAANPAASDAYDAVVPKKLKSKAAKDTPVKDKDTSASKSKASQQSISSFFGKPKGIKSSAGPATVIDVDDDDTPETVADADLDADYQLALKLSQEHDIGSLPPSQGTLSSAKATDPAETKMAWSNVFAKVEPPRCTTHNEPAKSFTVNKGGPNKGRAFFVCARPVGPGYDKGRSERLRSEVDHQYKCDFFMWATDAKRDRSELKVDR